VIFTSERENELICFNKISIMSNRGLR